MTEEFEKAVNLLNEDNGINLGSLEVKINSDNKKVTLDKEVSAKVFKDILEAQFAAIKKSVEEKRQALGIQDYEPDTVKYKPMSQKQIIKRLGRLSKQLVRDLGMVEAMLTVKLLSEGKVYVRVIDGRIKSFPVTK